MRIRASYPVVIMQVEIKFYLDMDAFNTERALYQDAGLKLCLPSTLAAEGNSRGDYKTSYGYVFPPFVVMERSQSLDEWARNSASDAGFMSIVQVCLKQIPRNSQGISLNFISVLKFSLQSL